MTDTIMANDSYTINEIIELVKENIIELPPIQRDFVWSPKKVEDLWDSLLRGFPIGCFICKVNRNKIEILDGQQRLTSILLGMDWNNYNQNDNIYLNNIKYFQEKVKIFLDLRENILSAHDFRKYNTRVITVSHPWGYQRKRNDKILEYAHIDKAKDKLSELFDSQNTKDHYWKDRSFFEHSFPYDCCDCVKMTDFLPQTKNEIFMYPGKDSEEGKIMVVSAKDRERIKNRCDKILEARIPFIYINDEGQDTETETTEDENEILDPAEYLFTLINTAGQRISNDDLNYSLVKSTLMAKEGEQAGRKTIDEINKACKKSHISPSRFMMICYFLWKTDADSLTISTRRFRTGLKDGTQKSEDRKDFISTLKEFYDEDGVSFIKKAEEFMVCSDKNENGMPYILFLDIINQNMPLAYLIAYLLDNERNFKNVKEYITSLIFILYIFGYKKRQRNTLRNLVQDFVKILKKQRIGDLKEISKQFFAEHKSEMDCIPVPPKKYNKKQDFEAYIKWEKTLLLFAQRAFLENTFEKGQFTLDDMNRPFDYDHIFPSKERGKYNCKNWDTIGNFRAWPYDKNRSDQADAPVKKFKESNKFIDKLLQDSFCYDKNKPNYFKIKFNKIGADVRKNRKIAEEVIRYRIRLIYEEWYYALKIGDLIDN